MMNEDQAKGMFLGLAIGDALGTTLEFSRPSKDTPQHTEITGGGPFGLPKGHFTDDTSMAIAMARSLVNHKAFIPSDIVAEWKSWYEVGEHSPSGECVDIGHTTREALVNWNWDRPYVGSTREDTSGNGGIMRMAPVIIWNRDHYVDALVDAVRQSMLTHASEECVEYAKAMATVLFYGDMWKFPATRYKGPTKFDDRGMPYSGGYVAETFSAACWCVGSSYGFEDALIKAVNLGYDADTVGAVTGQIAGRIYGLKNIPIKWLDTLAWCDKIEALAGALYDRTSV